MVELPDEVLAEIREKREANPLNRFKFELFVGPDGIRIRMPNEFCRLTSPTLLWICNELLLPMIMEINKEWHINAGWDRKP